MKKLESIIKTFPTEKTPCSGASFKDRMMPASSGLHSVSPGLYVKALTHHMTGFGGSLREIMRCKRGLVGRALMMGQ